MKKEIIHILLLIACFGGWTLMRYFNWKIWIRVLVISILVVSLFSLFMYSLVLDMENKRIQQQILRQRMFQQYNRRY